MLVLHLTDLPYLNLHTFLMYYFESTIERSFNKMISRELTYQKYRYLYLLTIGGVTEDGEYTCYNHSFFLVPRTREKYYLRTQNMPSYAVSFGTGRLGNQMSTFASIYAYERIHGVKSFVTARQAEVMQAYFTNQGKEIQF